MFQKGKRPSGPPGTVKGARPRKSILRNKRRRLSSPGSNKDVVSRQRCRPRGCQLISMMKSPSEPSRRLTETSQSAITLTPVSHYSCISCASIEPQPQLATPPRGDTSNIRDSPSSLFSAPSSPAPILAPPRPAAPKPSMLSMPPLRTNATEPPKKPFPPGSTGSQPKAVRKPFWLLGPKIKRFDAPNLKPGSTLPTKASLGIVRTSDNAQPSSSGRRGSIQTPTEASAPHSSSMLEESAVLEPGSNIDAQNQGIAPHSADAQMPIVQDVPRLPPASMAETEKFLSGVMPPEYVSLPWFVHCTECPALQTVGTHDVRFQICSVTSLLNIHLSEMALNQLVHLRPLYANSRLQTFSSE